MSSFEYKCWLEPGVAGNGGSVLWPAAVGIGSSPHARNPAPQIPKRTLGFIGAGNRGQRPGAMGPSERRASVLLGSLVMALSLLLVRCGSRPSLPPAEAIRHNNLGVALMDAGVKDPKYFAEAIKEFQAASQIFPAYRTARINLGMAFYYAGQADQASSTLEVLAREVPESLHVHYMLGLLKEMEGRFQEARQHFGIVTRQDPQDPNGWYHLGQCLSKEKQYLQAIEPFRKAAQLVPYQRRMRYNLYMALNRAGEKAEAQIELDRFRQLQTSNIRVAEAPKSVMEYLKQGKYAEVMPESLTVPAPAQPAPRYTNVAAEAGINFRHSGTSQNAEIRDVLQGKPRPHDWYLNAGNWSNLMRALGSGAAFCDYNNDGQLDVFLVNADGGSVLYERQPSGYFADVTKQAGLGGEAEPGMACAWGDYDNDGWTDLLTTHYGALHLYHNNHGHFEDVAKASGLARSVSATAGYMGAAFADVDHDGDTDIYVTCLVDLGKIGAKATVRFPDDFGGQSNLLFRNNSDGTFTEIGKQAGADAADHSRNVWFSDLNDDRAVDFLLHDSANRPSIFLNNKDGTFSLASLTPANLPAGLPFGESRAYGDFNGDGAVDELILKNGARAVLNRNNSQPANWLAVRLQGYAVAGKVKSNKLGIGAKVEVRSVGRWERQELRAGNGMMGSDAAVVYFDLGDQAQVDFVRAVFPSGVRWTLQNVRANQTITIDEPLLDVNSCPTVFAWNGKQFEFVTDTLSAGILGELKAPEQYWHPDPDEWLRITDQQLKFSSHDTLDIRFTNSLEEVTYLDQVRLLSVDHPESVEVYSDEKMTNEQVPGSATRLYVVTNPRSVARATDHHGHNVSPVLARTDRTYFDDFRMLPFKGFAEDWSLTLELGNIPQGSSPVLLLEGWSYWNSSASIVAATQAGRELWGPILEVRGQDGRWRTGLADMGVIAGLPRTMVLDLSRVLRGSQTVRLRSNRTLYYDRIWLADGIQMVQTNSTTVETSAPHIHEASVRSAQLRWLGYPRRVLPDGKLPEVFNYAEVLQQSDWGTHAGFLTRYGDVLPLLKSQDDQFVVMEHGEEIALSFGASDLPAVQPGWKRTFFFYSHGFTKGYELHSGASETVAPLPFRSMSSYPPHSEAYPEDEQHIRYLLEWNTRPSFWSR